MVLDDENVRERLILDRLIAAYTVKKATVHATCRVSELMRFSNLKRSEERRRKRSSMSRVTSLPFVDIFRFGVFSFTGRFREFD